MNCGHSALTRTPRVCARCARDLEKSTTAALVAEYTGAWGMGKTPPAEATLTTEAGASGAAAPEEVMASIARRVPWTTALRLMSTTERQSSRSPTPALLKQRWRAPCRRRCDAKAASRLAGSDTSATTTSTAQAGFAAATLAAVSAVASRETSTRVRPEAPSRARRRLRPRPMPCVGGGDGGRMRRRVDARRRSDGEALRDARAGKTEGFGGEGTERGGRGGRVPSPRR